MLHKLYRAFTKAVSLLCIAVAMVCPIPLFAQYIITAAGNGSGGYAGDGSAALSTGLDSVTSIAFARGDLYLNEQRAYALKKVNSNGIISTIAGKGTPGYSGDGGPGTDAQLKNNFSVAADNAGNVYIADMENHVIRKVNPAGTITTFAGNGTPGFSGDGGPATAAQLNLPIGVAVDNAGNVYVGDANNRRIRKIYPSGIIATIAGNGSAGHSGDGGPATYAEISTYIYQLATDDAGNLYISEGQHNCIRKVSTSGIITTVAGNDTAGYSGDGGPATSARLNYPTGVYVAHSGEIYIADCKNSRVRKVDNAGIITTVAGTGVAGYGGDNVLAVTTPLNFPLAVCGDADDNILIADSRNLRIRKIIKPLSFIKGHYQDIELCEGSTALVNDALAVRDFSTGLTDNWTLISAPMHGYAAVSYSALSGGGVITPTGLIYSPVSGYSGEDSFKVKVTNGTDNDITTIRVKVNPLLSTAGTITGPNDVCLGSASTLSASIPGGTWSSSNSNISVESIGIYCKVTGAAIGSVDVLYTLINGCGALSTSMTVTVNPLPTPGALTGADAVCLGSSITLSASEPGGIWNSSNGKATVTGGVVTGVAPGNEIIRYTVFNAWCESTVTKIISIETFPDAKAIWGSDKMCVGETITLTDSAAHGTWKSGSPLAIAFPITPPVPSSCIVSALDAGTATISYSITNSCGTDQRTHTVTIFPLPDQPDITEHFGLLSVPSINQSYQWTKNGVAIPGAIQDTFYAIAPALYAVTVTNEYGCVSSSNILSYSGCNPDDILLYPNPSNATVKILWCQRVNVRVLSIDGRVINILRDTNEVSLEGLPAAVYVLDIFSNNNKAIKTVRITKLSGQ